MNRVLHGLTVSLLLYTLLLWSQPATCAAQGRARAPRAAEDPLAATLRLAGGLESGLTKEAALVNLVRAHRDVGRLEEAVRAASVMDDGGMKALMLSRTHARAKACAASSATSRRNGSDAPQARAFAVSHRGRLAGLALRV